MTLHPKTVIGYLAPFVEASRIARMHAVLDERTNHLTALFDRVHDPLNVAACARTADTLGLQSIHAIPEVGHAFEPTDLGRATSLGAQRWLDLSIHSDAASAIGALEGYRIVALTPTGPNLTPLEALPLDKPIALCFGNERLGLGNAILEAAELCVALPMKGFSQSLNVSVSFGIALSALRLRLEREVPRLVWSLDSEARERVLADWLTRDVSHASKILEAMGKRA